MADRWLAFAQWLFLAIGPALLVAGAVACHRLDVQHWRSYLLAVVLGCLVAIAELVSRYRDSPMTALASGPAAIYLGVNALASVAALVVIRIFDWRFGFQGQALPVIQVLVAGLGSAAVFRSSVFTVVSGDQSIAIGPNAVLTVLLAAADRGVDRRQAVLRVRQALRSARELSFEHHADAVGRVAFAAMQNPSPVDRAEYDKTLDVLRSAVNTRLTDSTKALVLVLYLQGVIGAKLLRHVVWAIRHGPPEPSPEDPPQQRPTEGLPASARELLDQLDRAGGELDAHELQARLNLPWRHFAALLQELRDRGLVTERFDQDRMIIVRVARGSSPGASAEHE